MKKNMNKYKPLSDIYAGEMVDELSANVEFSSLTDFQKENILNSAQNVVCDMFNSKKKRDYLANTSMHDYEPAVFQIDEYIVGNIFANLADAMWSTNKVARGVFRYGTSPDDLSHEIIFTEYEFAHFLAIPDLQMDTVYFYEITATSVRGEIDVEAGDFLTSKEVTILAKNLSLAFSFITRIIQNLTIVNNTVWETEILNTIEPDGEGEFAAIPSVEQKEYDSLGIENTVAASDFDTAVT